MLTHYEGRTEDTGEGAPSSRGVSGKAGEESFLPPGFSWDEWAFPLAKGRGTRPGPQQRADQVHTQSYRRELEGPESCSSSLDRCKVHEG